MTDSNFNILRDEELVQMAREGSSTAEEFLIQKYRDLAKSKARLYFIVGGDNEDVIQEGMIGIFKAIRDYDPASGASFRTFVDLCITRQIFTAIKGATRQKHQILNESMSLSDILDSENGAGQALEQLPAGDAMDPETLFLINDLVETLRQDGVKVFSPLENQVWAEIRRGLTYAQIAEVLGRSPKSVDNAIQRIKKKIGAYLER